VKKSLVQKRKNIQALRNSRGERKIEDRRGAREKEDHEGGGVVKNEEPKWSRGREKTSSGVGEERKVRRGGEKSPSAKIGEEGRGRALRYNHPGS